MTEAEWLACADPTPMLEFLRGKASDRKLRLFACACCRRIWQIYDATGQNVIEVAERFADALATKSDRRIAKSSVRGRSGGRDLFGYGPEAAIDLSAGFAAGSGSSYAALNQAEHTVGPEPTLDQPLAIHELYRDQVRRQLLIDRSAQSRLVRDIFGNPFRPSPPPPPAVLAWNDHTIPRLAQAAYDERQLPEGTLDTARLGILADALLDAGFDDEGLLAHLRSPGPHVRGCWAVDLILGKS